uniref:Phosphatidic acid phosphatase type 2 domain-containing protein 1B n=1 Tax=Caligus clemensi TaxID=344056 RepID=C1C1Z8_CALCM|nr:Phosphatidic acid phosphatase type 2 domain-containing protein 1B [Caligus clemensi]
MSQKPSRISLFDFFKEISIRLGLTGLFLYTNSSDPFHRVISRREAEDLYHYPHSESYVTGKDLLVICMSVPLLTVLFLYYMKRDVRSLVIALLTITLILPLNGFVVNIIKIAVGRPRPDFLSRCWPNAGDIPWAEFDSMKSDQGLHCAGDPLAVLEGRKSFPSGHSSMAFASFMFVFLYTAGKLKTFSPRDKAGSIESLSLLIAFAQILVPSFIAISRTCDYHHHWQDVLVGSGIGSLTSIAIYNRYFHSIFSEKSDFARFQ